MSDEEDVARSHDPAMQSLIGKQLRSLYDSVLLEPIPDRLVELLIKLDDVTGANGDDKDAADGAKPAGGGESADDQ